MASADIVAYVEDRIRLGTPLDLGYPNITYNKFAGDNVVSHGGVSGLGMPIWEVWVFDPDDETVDNLGELIRIALQSFSGTAGGVNVSNVTKLIEQDGFDEDRKVHTRRLLFRIWYQEATA